MPKVHGQEIVKKSRGVRYFGKRRINMEYPPLDRPVTEYIAWFRVGDSHHGYVASKKTYDRLDVPETIRDSEADRKAWEEIQGSEANSHDELIVEDAARAETQHVFTRPPDKSLEAYKAWIRNMVRALGGAGDEPTDAEWEELWREFWSKPAQDAE